MTTLLLQAQLPIAFVRMVTFANLQPAPGAKDLAGQLSYHTCHQCAIKQQVPMRRQNYGAISRVKQVGAISVSQFSLLEPHVAAW